MIMMVHVKSVNLGVCLPPISTIKSNMAPQPRVTLRKTQNFTLKPHMHLFQSTLLPYVQNAKLGLAVDNTAPLIPQHLAFDGADWGQEDSQVQAFDDQDLSDPTSESTWDELAEYHSGDVYDHYVAPNQSIEDQFDYDHQISQFDYDHDNAEDSLHQDTLMYENHDVGDVTVDEEPFEDDQQ